MMKQLNSTIKGVITGILIILVFIGGYFSKNPDLQKSLGYIAPIIYGLGIVWAIVSYSKTMENPSFGNLFSQGFKCFVVVTLFITLYYIIFYKLNPDIIAQNAAATREYLLKNEKNRTPQEIETMVTSSKSNFITVMTSLTLFQNLIIGAIVSAATAGVLSLSKKK